MLLGGAALRLAQRRARALPRALLATLFGEAQEHARAPRPLPAAEAAIFLRYARRVLIVPGFGLAAAQAQHKLAELIALLRGAGVTVQLAVHPLAGRLPAQLERLLLEAGVPAELMLPMQDIQAAVRAAEVTLLIGANDVLNPALSALKSSPLYGLPLIDAAPAETLYVIKRGRGTGFARLDNPTLHGENCRLIGGDALIVLVSMVETLKLDALPIAA
jgi:NAD(P) transhydrogenase subunit beta